MPLAFVRPRVAMSAPCLKSWELAAVFLAAAGWLSAAFLVTGRAAAAENAEVIDGFVAAVQGNAAFTDEQKQQALAVVNALRADPVAQTAAITEGLLTLYPAFREALEGLGEEDVSPALAKLQELSASKDPYLAGEATFYLARGQMLVERYEDALKLLGELPAKSAGKTLQTGESLYLMGAVQSRLLQRDKAIATFNRFLAEHPTASERLRVGAQRHLLQLEYLADGSLADVFERMDYVRRKLNLEDSGKEPRDQQQKIIASLDKLIEEAEERECQCKGQGQSKKSKGQQSQGGGGEADGQGQGKPGDNDQSPGPVVKRTFQSGPQSPWSQLRDKDRDPAYSAIKAKFPARYQQLIEQYYKSFQEE